MHRLTGIAKNHDWGSPTLIPNFLGEESGDKPVAELWFGAHPLGSALLDASASDGGPKGTGDLRTQINQHPQEYLGASSRLILGDELPYLVKLIAPQIPLSLQVHPNSRQAREGYREEQTSGVALDARQRVFKDATHKPEMLYAITQFDVLAGFVVRREAKERLEGLDAPLARKLARRLLLAKGRGVRPVVQWVMNPDTGPTESQVEQFVAACQQRLDSGTSPEPLIDEAMVNLHQSFPGDPGILVAFLMNHVRLEPGETLFTPSGVVHSYQRGLGLEIMANSDNVVRAGLTNKHVDVDLFMDTAQFDGFPPLRIAAEYPVPGIHRFRSPVEDFELTVAQVGSPGAQDPLPLTGLGPRVLVALSGETKVVTRTGELSLTQGQAAFLLDEDGPALLEGHGVVAQCSVP